MALTAHYFVGEILIQNISGTSVIETANLKTLQIAIAKYEPLYLKKLLGEPLYDAYIAGIAETSPEARWTALQDKIYVENTDLDVGFSPAANYVYCYFLRNAEGVQLMNQVGKSEHENFTRSGLTLKITQAWNEMVRMSLEIQEWLSYDVADDYPEMDIDEMEVFDNANTFGI